MKSLEIVIGKMGKKPKKSKDEEMLAPFGLGPEMAEEEIVEDEMDLGEEGLVASADELLAALEQKDSKMLVSALKDFIAQVKEADLEGDVLEDEAEEEA